MTGMKASLLIPGSMYLYKAPNQELSMNDFLALTVTPVVGSALDP